MSREPLIQLSVAGATKRIKITDDKNPCSCIPNNVWDDPSTIVERKLDGHRFRAHIFNDLNRLDSRRPSINGGLFVEKTDNVPHIRDYLMPELAGTILDGELCAGKDSNSVAHALGSHATDVEKASIVYVVFDILFFRGEDVRDRPDRVRRAFLEMCFEKTKLGKCPNIQLIPRPLSMTREQKKQVLLDAMAAGEEGVMIKDVSQPYGKGWTKVKREARYDVVVMGYAPPKEKSLKKGDIEETITKRASKGWVGAIIFGQYRNGKLVECGQTSGMDDATLEDVSANKEKYLGRVFEISAQERFPTGRFRHPRFERWRDGEKLPEDCVYKEDEV